MSECLSYLLIKQVYKNIMKLIKRLKFKTSKKKHFKKTLSKFALEVELADKLNEK